MKETRNILISMVLMTCIALWVSAEEKAVDPYQTIKSHYEAIGGLDNVKAITSTYAEGTIILEGAGMEGTFTLWTEKPLKVRHEVDLTVIKSISGDNGEFSWRVDPNGKILIQKDERTIKERQVRSLMEMYDHLDTCSENFSMKYEGIGKVDEEECYVIAISNQINENTERHYYSTKTHYLRKTELITPDEEEHSTYSDFRKVDGLIYPFHVSTRTLPSGQSQTLNYTKYQFNMEMNSALFEPPQKDVEDYVFAHGRSVENIPFKFIGNNIYVPVTIYGKERMWVLDCGASVTVIDSSYAAELGLEFQGSIKAQAASGMVDLHFVTIPAFSLNGLSFNKQKVLTLSIRPLFKRILGMDIVGILGYDFLSRFVTKIDYANELLSFYHPDAFAYVGAGLIIDSPLSEERMFSVLATVDEIHSGRWQLDIGSSGCDFHYPYSKAHGLLNRQGIEAVSFGAAGAIQSKRVQFKSFEINGYVVKDPVIDIPQQGETGSFASTTRIGNIGNTILRHFVLYLDYANQQLIFEKGDDYSTIFPRSLGGVQLWYNDNGDIEVAFVAPGAAASDAGLQKGDIVEAVNGIEVKYLNGILALRELFEDKAGTVYVFTIRREGKTSEATLTLRDPYK